MAMRYNLCKMMSQTAEPSVGRNVVVAHDNYIEVIWDGAQSADMVRRSNVEIVKAAKVLQSAGKPMLVLLSIRNLPLKPDMGAFEEVVNIFRAVTFDRIAVVGTLPPLVRLLASTVESSLGGGEFEISYFADPGQALSWLTRGGK
jgi:hypothetical protein